MEPLPQFTLCYMEWIMSQSCQDERWQQQRLRDLQRIVQRQQKDLFTFFLTVDAIQGQYGRQQHSSEQLAERLEAERMDHGYTLQGHERQQKQEEQQLGQMEKQLQQLRSYAIQRRNKKAKRERQYHEVYNVPMVNTQYKKKYMRARDKNDAVEQQLSELHHIMDQVKERIKHHRQQGTFLMEQCVHLDDQRRHILMELDKRQELIKKMKQAQSFWCQFDTYHVQPSLEILEQQHNRGNDNLWTRLRLASIDYEETERYGKQYWNHDDWDIVFECTHCHNTTEGWPCLDKVRTTQLLCGSCYKDTRTSMIVEKKLYSILPGDKSRLSTLSNSSSVSIPSLISTTTKSTQSMINECKPFVKKMKSALSMNQQHKIDYPLPLVSKHTPLQTLLV